MARNRQVRRPTASPTYRTNYIKPRRQLHVRQLVRPAGYVLGLVLVLYVVFWSGWFDIRSIKIVGAKTIPPADLQNQTNTIMSASLLGKNTLFLSTGKIEEQLKAKNNQLGSVAVTRDFFNGLVITITEQTPSIAWRSGSSVFVLSSDGRAFAENKDSNVALPIVNDNAKIPVQIGQKVVPGEFVTFVQKVVSGLPGQGIEIASMSVPAESIGELYVQTKGKYYIKFDTGRGAEEQLSDLKSMLAGLAVQKKLPNEYIDLRIPDRIFYK
jgi:cell division septal protein FtsQ